MRVAMICLSVAGALAASGSAASDGPLLDPDQRSRLLDALARARSLSASEGNPHEPADRGPLYSGLPAGISPRLPENEGFIPFQGITEADDVPLGDDWDFTPSKELEELVTEDAWAFLPEGQPIGRRRDAQGREVWDYPPGTRLIHRLYFKAVPERVLFEARYMEKRRDGKWAMGLYHPEGAPLPLGGTGGLRLNTEKGAQTRFEVALATETVRVRVKRLSPDSCRHCHWAMGHGDYQYPDVDHAGPCGFVPLNPHAAGEWAKAYEKRYGSSPFSGPPAPNPQLSAGPL